MWTQRITRRVAWLWMGGFAITAACGSSKQDDDDDLPGSLDTTGTIPSGSTNAGTGTTGNNNAGFNNNGNTGTTGDMINQMNDNCVGIEPEAGEECNETGLVCDDERGRRCTCGGNSDFFPEGIWTCRGAEPGAGGAGGAGGEGGQSAGGAGGDDG